MMTLFFNPDVVTDWDVASRSDTARYAKYFWGLLDRGVYMPCSQYRSAVHLRRPSRVRYRCDGRGCGRGVRRRDLGLDLDLGFGFRHSCELGYLEIRHSSALLGIARPIVVRAAVARCPCAHLPGGRANPVGPTVTAWGDQQAGSARTLAGNGGVWQPGQCWSGQDQSGVPTACQVGRGRRPDRTRRPAMSRPWHAGTSRRTVADAGRPSVHRRTTSGAGVARR